MQGGRIVTATNHNAGLNGGISNGMPVVFRTVVKPTPSIYKPQDTVDYIAKQNAELSIQAVTTPASCPVRPSCRPARRRWPSATC